MAATVIIPVALASPQPLAISRPRRKVFMEALTYLERASDQCSSIAVMMLARNNSAILQNHYEYLREIHAGNDAAYAAEKARRREQYIKPLDAIQ